MVNGLNFYHDKHRLQHTIPSDDSEKVQKKLENDLKSRRGLNAIQERYITLYQNYDPLFQREDPPKQIKDFAGNLWVK